MFAVALCPEGPELSTMAEPAPIDDRVPDVEPIRMRDPLAEVLGLGAESDLFSFEYVDLVQAAGHSCPTAAGAFRIAALGLDALYPDSLPARGRVRVRVGGPADETAYGVTGRLLSFVTGAAGEDGFGGLPGGVCARRGLLSYEPIEGPGVVVRLSRVDEDADVEVSYDVDSVPPLGEAKRHLPSVVDGSASPAERVAFLDAWHGRVEAVLGRDEYFEVERVDGRD